MKRSIMTMFAGFLLLGTAVIANAATDGIYTLAESSGTWDGTDADRTKTISSDYDYAYGDEESLTYTLPWNFSFYGQSYGQVTVDTNGNIWFGATSAANSFSLPAAGRGPVSAAWNDDLSSLCDGGVFVQHKTGPERVVIEWRTETFTDEGTGNQNSFEVVLFPDGQLRFDYRSFAATSAKDFGSGISQDDSTHFISITATPGLGSVFTLAGRSLVFAAAGSGTVTVSAVFSGNGQGTVTSTPAGIACNTNCSAQFPSGTQITLHPEASQYSLFEGWSGGGCSGVLDCIFTPSIDTTVTASFAYDSIHQVQVGSGTPTYYSTIQSAYDASSDGATIRLWATNYGESLSCNRPVTITVQGGYNSDYTSLVGEPVLNGTLTITDGTLIVDGLNIQ